MNIVFVNNELFYNSLLKKINLAKHFIYIEVYMLTNGQKINSIVNSCLKKSKSGVKVVIVVDEYGFSNSLLKKAKDNINVELLFHMKFKIKDIVSKKLLVFNKRNHKKIYIVDDDLFIGSVNLCENHFNKNLKYNDVMVSSKVSYSTILKRINSKTNNQKFNDIVYEAIKNDDVDVLLSLSDHSIYRKKLYSLIRDAKSEIILYSPYYNLNRKILKLLLEAHKKNGVLVKIFVPYRTDYKLYDSFIRCYLSNKELNEAIEVSYCKSFLHCKVYCFDGFTLVGSQNMNYRSLYYDEEIVYLTRDVNVQRKIKEMTESLEIVERSKPNPFDFLVYYIFRRFRWFFCLDL